MTDAVREERSPNPVLLRRTRLAVAAVIVTFVALAGLRAITLPWPGTADSFDHLDYVHQVWNGEIPEPYGFDFTYPDRPNARDLEGRQSASAHPPGWYVVAAPVMGPLLDAGHWQLAVAAGRAGSILLGATALALMAWFAWRLGGRFRHHAAILVPAFGGLTTYYLLFSGDIYNDIPATAMAVGTVGTGLVILRHGLDRRRLAALAVFGTLAMAFRVTNVFALALALGCLAWERLARSGSIVARLRSLLVPAAVTVGLPAVVIGWFYVRNHQQSGAWYRSTPKVQVGTRPRRTMTDGLQDPEFYLAVPSRLFGKIHFDLYGFDSRTVSMMVVAGAALSIVVQLARARRLPTLRSTLVVGVLAGHVALLYGAQLSHIAGYGAINYRYFLPASAAIGAFLAVGVIGLGRAAWLGTAAILGACLWSLPANSVNYVRDRSPEIVGDRGWYEALNELARWNGVPAGLVPVLLALATAGMLVVVATIWSLPRPSHPLRQAVRSPTPALRPDHGDRHDDVLTR